MAPSASAYPPPVSINRAREKITGYNAAQGGWLIVLDDDPTGCQTVHNVPLLTSWEMDILESTLAKHRFFFILTNTRACAEEDAARINTEILERILSIISVDALKIISRSDSTLRGHFHTEVTTLMKMAGPFDGVIIIPYFREGLRFTADDTHYILEGEEMTPVHLTEFALDPTFGFKHSHLPSWIEDKTKGLWKKEDVVSISLETIRTGGVEKVCRALSAVTGCRPVIINALCDEDVEVAALGICLAEQKGKRFLYRSAASFVKIRAGMADAPLYTLDSPFRKGLVIVGSHVKKTTEQLKPLLLEPSLEKFEIIIQNIFSNEREAYLKDILHSVRKELQSDRSVLIYTEREYALNNHSDKLTAGKAISDFLSELVYNLDVPPDFIIAKGGITSHDIAVKGLLMKEALVLGQIVPGVPIWKSPAGSKFGGLCFVVFPGNVGEADTLKQVYLKFIH